MASIQRERVRAEQGHFGHQLSRIRPERQRLRCEHEVEHQPSSTSSQKVTRIDWQCRPWRHAGQPIPCSENQQGWPDNRCFVAQFGRLTLGEPYSDQTGLGRRAYRRSNNASCSTIYTIVFATELSPEPARPNSQKTNVTTSWAFRDNSLK